MEMLRQHVPVHYGFKLEREGISSLASVITSNYITGQTVRTFQGSLLVGADGKFSAGNAPYWGEGRSFFANAQFKVRETFNLWAWPVITYASTVVVARKRYESHFKKSLDLNDGAISQLFGNTRLMLITNAVSLDQVLMQLWYSRLAISNQDYNAFFGLNIDERDIPRVKCKFDARVARELDCLRPLPPPFAEAYDVCKGRGVSQKWYLNSVRMRSGLATDVFRGGASMPAALIGDAGHAVPDFLSSGGINWAMMDAIDLCSMIVQRYDDDEQFSRIAKDFYDLRHRWWQKVHFDWEETWTTAHGLQYDSDQAKSQWVRLTRTSRLPERKIMSESEFESLPDGHKPAIQLYKDKEDARWAVIQKRIRDRLELKHAFDTPPGIEATKVVLRYLDSRSLHDKDSKSHVEGGKRTRRPASDNSQS